MTKTLRSSGASTIALLLLLTPYLHAFTATEPDSTVLDVTAPTIGKDAVQSSSLATTSGKPGSSYQLHKGSLSATSSLKMTNDKMDGKIAALSLQQQGLLNFARKALDAHDARASKHGNATSELVAHAQVLHGAFESGDEQRFTEALREAGPVHHASEQIKDQVLQRMVAHQATLTNLILLAEEMPHKLLNEYRPLLNESHYDEHMASAQNWFTDLFNIKKQTKDLTRQIIDHAKCVTTTDCDSWACQAKNLEDDVNAVLSHAKFELKPQVSCNVGDVQLDVNAGKMKTFLQHGSVSVMQQTDLTVSLQLSDFVVNCKALSTASRMIAAQGYAHRAIADASEFMMPALAAKRNRVAQHLARSKSTYERLQNFTLPIHTLVDFSSVHPTVHDGALTNLLDEGEVTHDGHMDTEYQSMRRFVDGRLTSMVKADDAIVSAMKDQNPIQALYLEVKTLFRSKFQWVGNDPISFSVDLLKPILEQFVRPYNWELNLAVIRLGLEFTPTLEMPLEGRLAIKGSGEVVIDMDGPAARFNLMGSADPKGKNYEKGADFSASYLKFDGSVEVNFALGIRAKAELLGYLDIVEAINLRIGTSVEWDAKAGADAVLTKGNAGCNGAILSSGLTHYAEYCETDLSTHKKHLAQAGTDGDLVLAIGFWYYIPLPAILVWAEFKVEALGCAAGPTERFVDTVRDGTLRMVALNIGNGFSFDASDMIGALMDAHFNEEINYHPGDLLWQKMTDAEKEKEMSGFTHPLVNYKTAYDGYPTTPFLLRNTWVQSWKLGADFGSDGKWYFLKEDKPRERPKKANLMDGCDDGRPHYGWYDASRWGPPRLEDTSSRAGAILCCDSNGIATRHNNGSPKRNNNCISVATRPDNPSQKSPKFTYGEAASKCDDMGYELCQTQSQVNTACKGGCNYDSALVWTKPADCFRTDCDDFCLRHYATSLGEAFSMDRCCSKTLVECP